LKIFSVSKPASPNVIGQVEIGVEVASEISGITTDSTRAYVATRNSGVYAVDISDPSKPQVVSMFKRTLPLSIGVSAITVSQDKIMAAYYTGLLALNISNSDSLEEAWFFPTGGSAQKIELSNNLAYVASGYSGLWILDISDVSNPVGLANINTGGFTSDVEVAEDFAYIVNWPIEQNEPTRGLWIIDVSNPYQPKILSQYIGIVRFSQTRSPNALAKSGDLIFMTQMPTAGNDSTLEIIDIRDPTKPKQVSVLRSFYRPHYIAIEDSIAYLATADGGLRIIDVHNSADPIEINSILSLSFAVAVHKPFAFVLRDSILVINISDPQFPFVIGSAQTKFGVSSMDVALSDNYVYWAADELGAVDISNPENPTQIAAFSGNHSGSGVAARRDTVLFAEGIMGIWLLKNDLITSIKDKDNIPSTPPNRFQLYQNYPNPFNPQTTIEFDVPIKTRVLIEVYNVFRQQVKTLYNGTVGSGRHRINFDGSTLPSGVYFYRLTSSQGISITRRMMILQ